MTEYILALLGPGFSGGVSGGGGSLARQFRSSASGGNGPSTDGIPRRNITSIADFEAARNDPTLAANGPEVLYVTQNIAGRLQARGSEVSPGNTRNGYPGAHVTIECAPGVTVNPGSGNTGFAAIDLNGVRHWNAIRCNTVGGLFGIRAATLIGTADSPCILAGNNVQASGHAKLAMQGWWGSPWTPSKHIVCFDNEIHGTANDSTDPNVSEGIYIGNGGTPWVDRTSDIYVGFNHIYNLRSDGIEVKPGCRRVTVEANLIHDINFPVAGDAGPNAAISAWWSFNPVPGDLASGSGSFSNIRIQHNRIWNIRNRACIQAGYGGVEIRDNIMWDYNLEGVKIQSQSEMSPGDYDTAVMNNIMADGGFLNLGVNPGGAPWTVGPDQGAGIQLVLSQNLSNVNGPYQVDNGYDPNNWQQEFVGPITGTADDGRGPGSGFDAANGALNNPIVNQSSVHERYPIMSTEY